MYSSQEQNVKIYVDAGISHESQISLQREKDVNWTASNVGFEGILI